MESILGGRGGGDALLFDGLIFSLHLNKGNGRTNRYIGALVKR
jgi:hypothetical protein